MHMLALGASMLGTEGLMFVFNLKNPKEEGQTTAQVPNLATDRSAPSTLGQQCRSGPAPSSGLGHMPLRLFSSHNASSAPVPPSTSLAWPRAQPPFAFPSHTTRPHPQGSSNARADPADDWLGDLFGQAFEEELKKEAIDQQSGYTYAGWL